MNRQKDKMIYVRGTKGPEVIVETERFLKSGTSDTTRAIFPTVSNAISFVEDLVPHIDMPTEVRVRFVVMPKPNAKAKKRKAA